MSLALDVSTPPVARPLAPARVRRYSAISPSPSSGNVHQVNGVLGGLRERSEDELRAADVDTLRNALRQAWSNQDALEGRLEELETKDNQHDTTRTAAEAALSAMQSRLDESLNEQARLEADLEGRDELLDRLRGRANEAERTARECAKRALEQERSFEAERQALQAQESHLQQRIRSLLSARPSPPSASDTRTVSDLQEELASLNVSHSTLLAQLNTLTKEVHDLRVTNATLAEENEGWEFLLRERTLSGKVKEGGLLGYHDDLSRRHTAEGKGHLDVLDEEMEMDELHSDLEAQSPIMEDHQGFIRDLDQDSGVLSRSPESVHLKPPKKSRPKGESLGDLPVTGTGLDLAAELGRAEVDLDGSEMRVLGKGDEGEALRAEVKSLREENKALTLYCSKIIDRIIAQEGFEQILSVDYKTRRMGSRSASSTGRGNLREITNAMQTAPPAEPPAPPIEEKKARPTSMMVRAISSQGDKASPVLPSENKTEVSETKTEKRARRGFSLDFRSLGFGGLSGSTTPTEPKPNPALKPLNLPTRSTPVTAPTKAALGRRLEKHEEDEEDKRERHHLEATLKLMGVNRQSGVVPSSRKLVKPQNRPEAKEERQSLISPQSLPSPDFSRRGTPLSRLSSALGSSESPMQPLSPEITDNLDLSPEMAATAALKAFDEREAEQVKAISKGKAGGGYTSPPLGSVKRLSGRRTASGHSSRSPSNDREVPVDSGSVGQKVRESGSISTLWSMGSSRPNSQDVTPGVTR